MHTYVLIHVYIYKHIHPKTLVRNGLLAWTGFLLILRKTEYAHIYIYICIYISIAYAHPVASVKQMCTLMFSTSV